jgi:hypothetical protein
MTNITISDLHPTDFDLLSSSDSYMRELSDEELNTLIGGLNSVDSAGIALFIGEAIGAGISLLLAALFG